MGYELVTLDKIPIKGRKTKGGEESRTREKFRERNSRVENGELSEMPRSEPQEGGRELRGNGKKNKGSNWRAKKAPGKRNQKEKELSNGREGDTEFTGARGNL